MDSLEIHGDGGESGGSGSGGGMQRSPRFFAANELCVVVERPGSTGAEGLSGAQTLSEDRLIPTIRQFFADANITAVDGAEPVVRPLRNMLRAMNVEGINAQEASAAAPNDRLFVKYSVDTDDPLVAAQNLLGLQNRTRDDITLRAVSPNWYFGASPDNITTGGPGGKPRPFQTIQGKPVLQLENSAKGLSNRILKLVRKIVERITQGSALITNEPMEVLILDTAPSAANILAYYPNNEVLKNLIDSGKFHIGYAHDNPLILPPTVPIQNGNSQSVGLSNHNYPMSSHGLFVAGIIHGLAPNADIHLIQILNDYGVGDLTSLVSGLGLATENAEYQGWPVGHTAGQAPLPTSLGPVTIRGKSIIVNCSLTIGVDDSANLGLDEAAFQALLLPLKDTLQDMLDSAALNGQSIKIAAAAGNDSTADSAKPARYPARFGSVIGVSALNASGERAAFANIADEPIVEGVAIKGGDRSPLNAEQTSMDDNMVGLFVDPTFPGGSAPIVNENGWGRWSGTSFATATFTGLMAHIAAEFGLGSLDDAEELLRLIRDQLPTKIMVNQTFE